MYQSNVLTRWVTQRHLPYWETSCNTKYYIHVMIPIINFRQRRLCFWSCWFVCLSVCLICLYVFGITYKVGLMKRFTWNIYHGCAVAKDQSTQFRDDSDYDADRATEVCSLWLTRYYTCYSDRYSERNEWMNECCLRLLFRSPQYRIFTKIERRRNT